MVGRKLVGLTVDNKCRNRFILMHQESLCEFQRQLKFGTEDKKWWYKCQDVGKPLCYHRDDSTEVFLHLEKST